MKRQSLNEYNENLLQVFDGMGIIGKKFYQLLRTYINQINQSFDVADKELAELLILIGHLRMLYNEMNPPTSHVFLHKRVKDHIFQLNKLIMESKSSISDKDKDTLLYYEDRVITMSDEMTLDYQEMEQLKEAYLQEI